MPTYSFMQVDAFTDRPLCGNPCAILFETDDLDEATMLAIAREIPANGYGIADCVAVSWKPTDQSAAGLAKGNHFLSLAKPTVRAFEAKLHDWRRALLQANRYRFFAHVPIVVLPAEKCRLAVANLDTFRLLKVGLWSFDPATDHIFAHFTPRPSRPRDIRQASRALALVARASKALPIF